MSKYGRQNVLAALIVRTYGQYDVKFYNLYFVESGILCSYQGISFRNFFLRWDVTLGRIRSSVDVDIILDAHEENYIIPWSEISSITCRTANSIRFGKVHIARTDGSAVKYVLGAENRTKNPCFGHLMDDLQKIENLTSDRSRSYAMEHMTAV